MERLDGREECIPWEKGSTPPLLEGQFLTPKATKLEKLKSEYESQLESLRDELASERHKQDMAQSESRIKQMYQQEMNVLKQQMDVDSQQRIDQILQQVDGMIHQQLQEQHSKHQDEINLQIQAMRLTLDQIYQGQLELVQSEEEIRHQRALQDLGKCHQEAIHDLQKSHQEAMHELQDNLSKGHKEELNRVEAEWSSRLAELQQEHEEELNDSLMEDSLSSDLSQASILHKLNKKLSDEHRQLLKKISEGLEKSDTRVRSPKKSRQTQGQQTDSEDGETDSIRSLPVTGQEFHHLDVREKVLHKAEDVHHTLETQREEIAALRSRMLEEYERLLSIRAEVMATQTQEVEKLQKEMEQLQQSYEDQIKTFQVKVESQTEEAMMSRLNEEHSKEIQELKLYYETQIAELRKQEQEVTSLQYTTPLQANLYQTPEKGNLSAKNADEENLKKYIKHTTTLTVISSDEDRESSPESESRLQSESESKLHNLEKLLSDKDTEISVLKEKLNLENQLDIDLREKVTMTESKLIEMEKLVGIKQCEIDEIRDMLKEKDSVLKILEKEKNDMEEKYIRDLNECESNNSKIIGELSDKLLKLQEELDSVQEASQTRETHEGSGQPDIIVELNDKILKLQQQIDNSQESNYTKVIEELSDKNIRLQQQLQESENASGVQELNDKIVTLQQQLEESQKSATKTIDNLNDKLSKLQQELDASQEQERVLEEQYDELQHQHQEEIEALRQDLEYEHKAEVMDVQSEFKVQMEIELKRQAADLAFDYEERLKQIKEDFETRLKESSLESVVKSNGGSTELSQQVVKGERAQGHDEPDSVTTPTKPTHTSFDDETDSLSKSTETASTVIETQKNVKTGKQVATEDSGDKTDDDMEEMETETASRDKDQDQGGKPKTKSQGKDEGGRTEKMEEIIQEDDSEEPSESSSASNSESQTTTVTQLVGKINQAKEQTFMKLKAEYELKIQKLTEDVQKLTEDLEQAMALNDDREKFIDEISDKYEAKINDMRTHYEMRIKELEETDIDIEDIKEKVKSEFVKNYEAELAGVHLEYEEKMELIRQEMQENFDTERQSSDEKHQGELAALEEKYDNLVESIRNGEVPEVADLVRDRIDTELEMAKTLMQQEFEETIESEQARFNEMNAELEKKLEEKEKDLTELQGQYERDIAECRNSMSKEFQTKMEDMESHYNKEIQKLQKELESGIHSDFSLESKPQEAESDVVMSWSVKIQEQEPGVSGSSEMDTDVEVKDSGIYPDRRDSSGDLDNSIRDLKGSHAAMMAQIEEEFNVKLQNLKQDLEQEYEEKILKLQQELASTQSEETEEVDLGSERSKDDLDIAHAEELKDLEIRLTEKHSKDLFNLEHQYQKRIEEIQQQHQAEISGLQKVLEYLQQTEEPEKASSLGELKSKEVSEDLSCSGPKRSTPVQGMEGDGSQVEEDGQEPEKSIDLIKFESSHDESISILQPPSEKPPEVPRDAGIDLLGEEIVEPVASTITESPTNTESAKEISTETLSERSSTPKELYTESERSTPSDMLQTRMADTLQGFTTVKSFESSTEFSAGDQQTASLSTELQEKENKIKELEKEIESLQSKFDEIVMRRDRESQESRNLEMMLKGDLERLHLDRESIQMTNDHLLALLSEAVRTYLSVEETINKKLAKMVSGGHPVDTSPSVQRSPMSGRHRSALTAPHQRSPPSSHHQGSPPSSHHKRSPPEPVSPGGAEGGDVPPHETSIMSNLTDEGLDLSQRTITESMFQGPDLDNEGEELLADASHRLQSSVTRLLDMIEDTTQQLYDTKKTQQELVTTVSSEQQESLHISTRCDELEERLRNEVEAKEYLAMELHKAEGLIEGYSTEREQREVKVQELEEKTEALILELETTKNKLQDLEQSHHENTSLRSEMQRQQALISDNVGEEAQALMRELNVLNDEKRTLQQQLRTTTEKYESRITDLQNAGEETEQHYIQLLEEKKVVVQDLQLQLESVEKQLKSNRQFLDEQAIEREQEREEFIKEVDRWKKALSDRDKQHSTQTRLQREVDTLTEELQDRIDSHSEIVMQTEKLQRDLSDKQMTTEELAAVVRQLEQEVDDKAQSEQHLKQKIQILEAALQRRPSLSEFSDKQEEPEEEEMSESESCGSETRTTRRRRMLPSHISLQQEEALIQEKEQLQTQLEEQMKQISALRNQLDEMRYRGEYSGGEDSQATSLQRQLDRQIELSEEKDRQNAELKEQVNDLTVSLSNKDKYISQLSNQVKASKLDNQSETMEQNQVDHLRKENSDLQTKLRSIEKQLDSTPMSVLTQNLIEEKNQEIDHLTSQIAALQFEISALKSGEAIKELQSEVEKLRSDLQKKESEFVRASHASTFSEGSDTEGTPGVTESFSEKTNLQQEIQDSVAQKMEELEQLKSALQQKEEEISDQKQTLQEKDEIIDGLNLTLDEKVDELDKMSKELQNEKQKKSDQGSVREDAYLNEILQEKEALIEQMNIQLEGLNSEVESLTDFQNKLQDDFDTVQHMLEEKEKELDVLTKELSERQLEDNSQEMESLNREINQLKKEIKEKENVIEEKAEEMYLLNEKLEQQESLLKENQGFSAKLAEKESEILTLQKINQEHQDVKVLLEEKTKELQLKSDELENLREEFSDVKEHLTIAENLQRKLEQAGLVSPDLIMREKEEELQKVKSELIKLKENMQPQLEDRDLGFQKSFDEIERLKSELTAIRELVRCDDRVTKFSNRTAETLKLKEQIQNLRKLVHESRDSHISLSREELASLVQKLIRLASQEEVNSVEEIFETESPIQSPCHPVDQGYDEENTDTLKEDERNQKRDEMLQEKNLEIQQLKKNLLKVEEKEEEIKLLKAEIQRMVDNAELLEEERMLYMSSPDRCKVKSELLMTRKPGGLNKPYHHLGMHKFSSPLREVNSVSVKDIATEFSKHQNEADKTEVYLTDKSGSRIVYPKQPCQQGESNTKQLMKRDSSEVYLSGNSCSKTTSPQRQIYHGGPNVRQLLAQFSSSDHEKNQRKCRSLSHLYREKQESSSKEEFENLAVKVRSQEEEIDALMAELKTKSEEIQNLKFNLEESEIMAKELSANKEESEEKVQKMVLEMENLNQAMEHKKQEMEEISVATIAEKDNKIQDLEHQLQQVHMLIDAEKEAEIEVLKNQLDMINMQKDEKIHALEDEVTSLNEKLDKISQLEEECKKLKAFEEELDDAKQQDPSDETWTLLQQTQDRLEQTTHELTNTTSKLKETENRLGAINSQLSNKENDLQSLQAEFWEKTAQMTEELQHTRVALQEREAEVKELKTIAESAESKQELDAVLNEKNTELQDVKERLKEAVELSEQQLHIVEQKDEEFMKLKLEIQQMISEKDKTIRDLKKQIQTITSEKDTEITDYQAEIKRLENQLNRLKKIQDSSVEAGGDAISLVNVLKAQLEERDKALKEIHSDLQKSKEELETKTQELSQVKAQLEQKTSPTSDLSQDAQQQFHQLEQELKTAKEALAEMQRQAGVSRESSVERLPALEQRASSVDSSIEVMDVDELRQHVQQLNRDLNNSRSEVELYRKSASMSAKDFVQKVMELREELSSQHQRHIQDLTDRCRQEADTNLAQLRIKYDDEIEHLKKLHQKEISQQVGEVTRDLEKKHKTEINTMLARHRQELELARIREPVIESQDASVLNLANQLQSEIAMTERLDSRLLRSLAQQPDGQENVETNTIASSEASFDDTAPSRLQVLMNRLHKEGVQMLTISELQFLNQHMPPSHVDREVDITSLQAAWENEKQSLLSAVQSLKDLLAQTHKLRGVDKATDVSDWRGELLRSIGYVFAKERETLLAELRSHVLSHPNVDLSEIQRLEQKVRNQEAHQKSSLEQIFSADRQSLLAELRDLRAHSNISTMKHQDEKERLMDQLNNMEDQTSKRERQLKRQVQLLEYKLQQEKIIQDDLRTSLEVERDRTSDLSNQLSREKNSNLDLQTDLSNQQIQISKLKDGLEREQSRFVSVTGALEEEKGKCQHLSELLERERTSIRQLRSQMEDMKLSADSKERQEDILERFQSELNTERDRRIQSENAEEIQKVALANLQQELELERKNLRSTESEYKARVKQLSTAVELERAKSADLQGALERERSVNDKLRQNLDSERRSLLESTDRENSIFEDLQMELDTERAKLNDLKNALDREKQRLQSHISGLESQASIMKDELEQERLTCRQMKNEIDQIQLQKLDITRHYEHERDQVARLKAEREHLRSEVKTLKDMLNEKERTRDTEKVTERRSQRQLERERDDHKMKMHENELEIQRLTQKVLDLEDQVTASREKEMEISRELQQEKLRSSHHAATLDDSDQDHWSVYKTQLESICQSLQYLVLQYQDQLTKGPEGSVNVRSLQNSLTDLLSELRQTQMPLTFESENNTNLMSRPSAHAVNDRVLHHNSELTNFVSRLTEEKMELRNTLGRLEEEIWRYRQRDSYQNGHDLNESATETENKHLEARASWAKERLSLQLALNQMEQELDRCRMDLRYERERRSTLNQPGGHTEADREKIQRLYGKYLRADSYRKALIYQKKYLLLLLGGFQDCEETTLALIARMGAFPSPEDMRRVSRHRRPFTMFRSAARVVIAVSRMRYLVRKWKRATRVGSPVMGGTVDLQQGYMPNTNSFSPPRITTSSRINGATPIQSSPFMNGSTPLHPSSHVITVTPHLSSSLTARQNFHSSPYQAVEGASGGNTYVNGANHYSVHMTPPTKDYSNVNQTNSETSGARRKILSSVSNTPKSTTPSPQRRVRIADQTPSLHDDYISRLENLQLRLGNMESESPKSRPYPRR